MEKWELAYQDYLNKMKYKDIAEKYDVSINTVKSWKSRKWNAPPEKKVAHKTKKVAHKKEVPKAVEALNDNDELNDQQKMFCLYYLQSFNATQSYLKAYKCSYSTAMVEGHRSLRNPKIKKELDKIKQELQSTQYFTIQDIINEYAKQAFSNIKDILTFGTETVEMEDGSEREFSYVRLKDDSEVDGTLIQEVKQGKDGVSAKLWDKQKAMEQLMKYLGAASGSGDKVVFIESEEEMLKYMEENAHEYDNVDQ